MIRCQSHCGFRQILAVLFVVLLYPGTAVTAQEIRGTLKRADGESPASGAIVEIRKLSGGDLISRTITDGEGRFRILTNDDSIVVRVLRIGWRPVVVDTVSVQAGSVHEVFAVLPELPVELAPVRSTAESKCQQLEQASVDVVTLYSDIRTALLASQLYVPEGVPQSRFRVSIADWSANQNMLLDEKHSDYQTDSLRPFRSLPPRTLLSAGFVTYDRQNTANYRAPDAELLTSDEFHEAYCLRLVQGDTSRPGWTGIGFEPARSSRSTVQIRGTIWASGNPRVLERVEFSYVGLDPISELGNPGGWVEYTSLEDGHWFASQWELRMPKIGAASVLRRRDMRMTEVRELSEIRILHGEVLEVSIDGRTSFISGAAEFIDDRGRLVEDSLPDPELARTCVPSQGHTFMIGSVSDTIGRPLAGARLTLAWRSQSPEERTEILGTSESNGHFLLCNIPADRAMRLQVEATGFEGAAVVVRAPGAQRRIQLDLRLFSAVEPF